ncbi:MAG: hypothetical protein ACKO9Q_12995 [Pirellula sp.]
MAKRSARTRTTKQNFPAPPSQGGSTGTEVLLAYGDDPQTSRTVAEFVVRSLLSYSRP